MGFNTVTRRVGADGNEAVWLRSEIQAIAICRWLSGDDSPSMSSTWR